MAETRGYRTGGADAAPVRPMIVASWRRSVDAGLSFSEGHARYHPDLDFGGRLPAAAQGPLDRLSARCGSASAVLGDARSRVLVRIDADPDLGRLLEQIELAPGFDYSESSVGTNALGTALEAHRIVDVRGDEHFSERLRPFSCLAVPVRDPLTGRVEGILDVTARAEDFSAGWQGMLLTAAAEIEHALLADRSEAQHALFDAYARRALRSRDAVGAVGAVTLLVNRIMHDSFDRTEQDALRAHAELITEFRERAEDSIELPSGREVRIRAQRVGTAPSAGIVFDVRESAAEARRGTGARESVQTPAILRARQEIAAALRENRPLVLTGEAGAGKASLARAVYRAAEPQGRVVSVECAEDDADRQISAALASSGQRLLLLRHTAAVEGGFDGRAVLRAAHTDPQLRVLATFTAEESDPSAVSGFAQAVIVPSLRRRVAEIPALAAEILKSRAPGRWLSAAAERVLMRYDWPGNIPQLERALALAVEARPVGAVRGEDLPHFVLEGGGLPTGSLEQAERATIIDALRDTGGNRVHAARLLGISRATLYRKLHRYGIAPAAG